MPSSRIDGTEEFVKRIMREKPKRILDVGCGFGRYGFLCREFLDIWASDEPYIYKKTRIEAIEVFDSYIGHIQNGIYNYIYTMDASITPWNIGEYDLIIMSDVLEHMEKPLVVLEYAMSISKLVYVKTPIKMREQKAVYGNEFEKHLSYITIDSLRERGDAKVVGDSFVGWLG